ncbi:uncharacterized protein P174DRAFT_439767 [Aspergillus novofumigatus IBT 16806]|uniref:Uncharacterized protein n=1 Tax=Aspergillus novofumigatus (strain IBT 16806) TaxID=1392255 RepID=A0A2I1CBW9_ASPN1|nr:uncharacterized protein P174DRAFT_439767 [Aspergillus novofumigatus IBT 16806]PKX95091.1 hypothetical protein P174DRAFT_439767 [Aspergillus novofumigatus IBT 16806]
MYAQQLIDDHKAHGIHPSRVWPTSPKGVKIMAPPIFALLNATADGETVPSAYAVAAKKAGLDWFLQIPAWPRFHI